MFECVFIYFMIICSSWWVRACVHVFRKVVERPGWGQGGEQQVMGALVCKVCVAGGGGISGG